MPTRVQPVAPAPPPALPPAHREKGLQLIAPLQRETRALSITDEPSYLRADGLLGRVVTARRTWAALLSPVTAPLKRALTAAKEAMEGARDLNREIDGPMEEMERRIKDAMKDYKIEERYRLLEAQRAREAEEQRIAQEAQALEERARAARTAPMRERLAKRREDLVRQAEVLEQQPEPTPVVASTSTTRTTPSWRIADLHLFLAAVIRGDIPDNAVAVDRVLVQAMFRDNPAAVGAWPGVELYDEVIIVRR